MADKAMIHPVILSGGAGTRLWPLSRALLPKQLIPLMGEVSLIVQTMKRVGARERFAPPMIVCNDEHRFLVAEELRSHELDSLDIVLEPVGRNTAPAACVAALRLASEEPDALLLLLPSDHHIPDQDAFAVAVERAADAARGGWLATFGVAPEAPETGYGYIRHAEALDGLPGCFRVASFVEKPDLATAEAYLASGDYAWNSGMFLFSARSLLEETGRHAPAVLEATRRAVEGASRDLDFLRLDAAAFAEAPSISIDHAVMEKTDRAAIVPVDIGWSDVGSWDSLWQVSETDTQGNARVGDILALDTQNSYLHSESQLLATVGIEDLIVVATTDAVLVCPRDRAQDIREIVSQLEASGREEHQVHAKVRRPWGSYETIDTGDGFQAKRLTINPGASISLQRHKHRAEHWVVVRGTAEVTRDNEVFALKRNESTFIPRGAIHRLHNPGEEPLHIIEVQSGDYLGEDDIERFEDIYGRG